ncbi:MAG: precorrin-2 C(20)-methyltransferase [Alphaproteobacteria bacterium]|nr:precorrin-2 C(20)-methyltransferase [Alphaproteobacteria bacterium]
MTGTAIGIGVGPGDPELMTLKGARILASVPIVAYPAPETGDSLARRIAAAHLPKDTTEIAIRMPLSSNRFPVEAVYDRAAEEIGLHLGAGRDVAILCEGDPFFYGSFMYLFARLSEQWPVEVVPGVSSLTACAAVSRKPLAALNDVLTVIPATLPDDVLRERLAATDAAAIIKVGRHLPRIRAVLDNMGLADSAEYIEHATMADENHSPLTELEDAKAPYFSMILVHRRGAAWA